jgi:hypothetical protein
MGIDDMSDTFFSHSVEDQMKELVNELYKRLSDTRGLLEMYEMDPNLNYVDRGYAQGIREEKAYLERMLDRFERI